jgi:putative transposase
MPDHVHLVVYPGRAKTLSQFMQLVKGRFARFWNVSRGCVGNVWQDRYHERGLRSEAEVRAAIEYVHRNPVAARFAECPEAFRWSSANQGFGHLVDLRLLSG